MLVIKYNLLFKLTTTVTVKCKRDNHFLLVGDIIVPEWIYKTQIKPVTVNRPLKPTKIKDSYQ